MNNIVISKASPEDAYQITSVRRKTWLSTYPNKDKNITKEDIEASFTKRTEEEESNQRVKRIADDGNTRIWVAKQGDIVGGFVEAKKDEEKNRIRAFYILPEYQHKGLCTELITKVLELFGNEKLISCEVANYNVEAISFYKKFGFVENGITHNEVSKLSTGKEIPEIEMVRGVVL
jgi:ribosomal protein S18 acetylase RimI-like enzyme